MSNIKTSLKNNPDLMATYAGRKYMMSLALPLTSKTWKSKIKAIIEYAREQDSYAEYERDREIREKSA